MTPRASAALVLGGVLALGVLGACGVPKDAQFKAVAPADIPYGLQETTTTTLPLPPSTTVFLVTTAPPTTIAEEAVTVFFVLGRGIRPVARPQLPPVVPQDALDLLQRGPLEEDRPVGLRSAILPDMIREVKVAGGVATVDLAPSVLGLTSNEQILAFAQIVATLASRPGIGPVAFTIDGKPIEPYRADGTLAPDTVSIDDYRTLLPYDPNAPTTTAPSTTAVATSTTRPSTPSRP